MRCPGALPCREAISGAIGHAVLRSPPLQGGRIWSYRTHGAPKPSPVGRQDLELYDTWRTRALSSREAGSGATVHVAAPEPFLSGMRDPEPLDTQQPRSPPWLGGMVRCCMAHGGTWVYAPLLILT
jgi:hypothetical protein